MTYHELVKKAQETYGKADASKVNEHVAIQFNITGESSGIFYLEIADGKVNIEPYEYFDRDVIVTTDAQTLIDMAEGKTEIEKAYLSGKIKAEGNLGKGLLLKELVLDVPVKKTVKKTTEKKTADTTKKTAAKKTTKTTTKKAAQSTKTTKK